MNATSPFDIQSAAIDTTANLTDDDKFFVNINGEPSEQIITVLVSKSEYYKEDNQMYDDYGNPNELYMGYDATSYFDIMENSRGNGIYTCRQLRKELKFMIDYILDMYDNVELNSMTIEYVDAVYNRRIDVRNITGEPHFILRNSSCLLSFMDSGFTSGMYRGYSHKTALEALLKSDIKRVSISFLLKTPKEVEKFIDDYLREDTIIWKIKKWFSRFM